MKSFFKTFVFIFISILAFSCSNDDEPAPIPAPTPIASGPASDLFAIASTNGSILPPFVYKNTTKTNIVTAANERATLTSIYVNGGDVYITGNVTTTTAGLDFQQACYWKNNVKVNVSHAVPAAGGNKAIVEAIAVVGTEVYTTGNISPTVGSPSRILLWRNGASSFVSELSSSVYYYATSISVFGCDVYVSGNGFVRDDSQAIVWKNGVRTELSAGITEVETVIANSSGVHALFVEFGSGRISNLKYWKDGEVTTISSQLPSIGEMSIKGNDVYISGAEKTSATAATKACYWKNGIKTELIDGNNKIAGEIKLGINGDLFIAEKTLHYDALSYWKNGIKATLGNSTDVFMGFDINNKF